mmetsp:Transcript_44780/g.101365  ORF Transcript_44780/g.101365 Transcript_44780/m.101365 type:complete len:215 (-) Transcript_44780:283-927(-)
MRLAGEGHVIVAGSACVRARTRRGVGLALRRRRQALETEPPQRRRIILESNHRIPRVLFERLLHQLKQGLLHRLPVHHQLPAEEPVPRVLRVPLSQVKALHGSGVPLQVVHKKVGVVLQVKGVKSEAIAGAELLQGNLTVTEHVYLRPGHRLCTGCEGLNTTGVDHLCHPVVNQGSQGIGSRLVLHLVPLRPLDADHGFQPARPTNRYRVGRPG